MKLSDIGEFGFIDRFTPDSIKRAQGLIQGIGDDAAVLEKDSRSYFLVTTDLLIEDVHFLRNKISPWQLGRKSLAVNLSDIAAMGGIATEAFLSLGIPKDMDVGYWDDFYRGFKDLAARWEVNLSGGDTTRSKGPIVISVTVIGDVPIDEVIYRKGAQPGDRIAVTGFLGDSAAGLDLIINNRTEDESRYPDLIKAHNEPIPHLAEGRFLAHYGAVTAMIDISDGLTSDLGHIVERSSIGATVELEKIPLSKSFKGYMESKNRDKWKLSLGGGEDYVLLCTITPDRFDTIRRDWEKQFRRPLYDIGVIEEKLGLRFSHPDGAEETLFLKGFDHFA
jgi:thiamine-monophosphate kinase